MVLLLSLWLCTTPLALAQSDDSTPVRQDFAAQARADLEAAKALYFAGGHDRALAALQQVVAGLDRDDPAQADVATEALVYLGEIQYVVGDRASSWSTFNDVLAIDPDYRINTFLHPAEVVDWFDLVAREVQTEQPRETPPVVEPPAPPAWTFAPFGIPQLAQGQTGAGIAFATAQVVTGGASIGLHLALRDWKRDLLEDEVAQGDPRITRANTVKWGAQIPLTASFYVLWVTSSLLGRSHFRAEHPPTPTVSMWVDPTDRTLGLGVRW